MTAATPNGERERVLQALRPIVEAQFGRTPRFEVISMNTHGDWTYTVVKPTPQGPIPGLPQRQWPAMQALLQRTENGWRLRGQADADEAVAQRWTAEFELPAPLFGDGSQPIVVLSRPRGGGRP